MSAFDPIKTEQMWADFNLDNYNKESNMSDMGSASISTNIDTVKITELPRTINWIVAEVEMLQHAVDDLSGRLQPVLENVPQPSVAEVEPDPSKVPGQVITSEHAQKIQSMVVAIRIETARIRRLIDRLEV